jgi:hypothetical protein
MDHYTISHFGYSYMNNSYVDMATFELSKYCTCCKFRHLSTIYNLFFVNSLMEVDQVELATNNTAGGGASNGGTTEVNKESDHTLETIAIWVTQYIQVSSTSLTSDFYTLLPFFCQFVGNETVQEVSQSCLKALCFLSVCICPTKTIGFALEMVWKVTQSPSWKAKMSILEFVQTFVFTNFMAMCSHDIFREKVENLVVSLMSDETLQVQNCIILTPYREFVEMTSRN